MRSEIFKIFYSRTRARQQMQFLVNFVQPKSNTIPEIEIRDKENNIYVVSTDSEGYFDKTMSDIIKKRLFDCIIKIPKHYIYNLNDYNIDSTIADDAEKGERLYKIAMDRYTRKIYQFTDDVKDFTIE